MAASSCNSTPVESPATLPKGKKSRRVWTKAEETALIHALRELKGKGLKVDNAFRAGYLLQIEKAFKNILPNTDIRHDPQIKSKMTIWKKVYGNLYSMFDLTGGGASFCPITHTIQVVTEQWWTEYLAAHPYVDGYREKTFPYYEQWGEFFGKDRATGAGAEDISAAVQDVINNHDKDGSSGGTAGGTVGVGATSRSAGVIDLDTEEATGDNMPLPQDTSKMAPKELLRRIKKEKGLKRKRTSEHSEVTTMEVPPSVDELVQKTNEIMERIALLVVEPRAAPEDLATTQRKGLYAALLEFEELEEDDRIAIVHKLAHSKEDCDVFYALPQAAQLRYLRVITQKRSKK